MPTTCPLCGQNVPTMLVAGEDTLVTHQRESDGQQCPGSGQPIVTVNA